MIHDARVIPLDNRPHVSPKIRSYFGDPRGHWDGDTLVVDVTNFSKKAGYRGATTNLHVIERFRRTDASTVHYELTVEDPTTFSQPWTAALDLKKDSRQVQVPEYACHEGNYAMFNILSGARAAAGRYVGSVIDTLAPPFGRFPAATVPRWSSIRCFTIARPRPVPPGSRARDLSTR
jgi:hypothetical protein